MQNQSSPEVTVFIVDDDDVDRELIGRACAEMGVYCEQYSSPLALLEDLNGESAGCIVTDLRMPEMSGMQLYRRTRARGLSIATIIVTGYKDAAFASGCMGAGLFGYCSKNENTDDLKELIAKALAYAAKPKPASTLRY